MTRCLTAPICLFTKRIAPMVMTIVRVMTTILMVFVVFDGFWSIGGTRSGEMSECINEEEAQETRTVLTPILICGRAAVLGDAEVDGCELLWERGEGRDEEGPHAHACSSEDRSCD